MRIIKWYKDLIHLEIKATTPSNPQITKIVKPGAYVIEFVDAYTCRISSKHQYLEKALTEIK